MSFRARLTSFFVLIVVVPMAAVGFLVFRLIDDSQRGKADARAQGIAASATSLYESSSRSASFDARTLARDLALVPESQLSSRVAVLARDAGLQRVTVSVGSRPVAEFGDPSAIAPGVAVVRGAGGRPARTIEASELVAGDYARELRGTGTQIVVSSGGRVLATTLSAAARGALPSRGSVTLGGSTYRVDTVSLSGFAGQPVAVAILSNLSTGGSLAADRVLAGIFIIGFLVLAFFFALLASRALQGQLARFLEAARRLGSGDFSSPVPTSGRDEFAALGEEFNAMSRQLARRLEELEQERARVRTAIRRIGEVFASNLDREALLELSLKTALDATDADRGRVSARPRTVEPLSEIAHVGRLGELEAPLLQAERRALEQGGVGEATSEDGTVHLAAVALGRMVPGGPTHGLITVCRENRPFTADDRELLRSLADRATLALDNVNLHHDVQRQAITDDLTGLATHGHFQELLEAEMEEVRRYRFPVGLIMLDIDDFKSVNDVYGHQQGDLVLRWVADALRATSRDVDLAARYGGEEMALILPHTDLEGAAEMAERVRASIEGLAVPHLDGDGVLHITASVGVASSADGHKNDLIAAADAALYSAKRSGKNRVVRATPEVANVSGGE